MLGWTGTSRGRAAQAALQAISKSQLVVKFALDRAVIDANDNFCRTMGYDRDSIAGLDHRDLCPPGIVASIEYEEFWHVLTTGQFLRGRYKRIARDGREVWLEASYNPLLSITGKPEAVLMIATDITADVVREVETAGKLDAIQRSQLVLEIDPDGVIRRANRNFLALAEMTEAEVVGRKIGDLCSIDAPPSRQARQLETLRSGRAVTGIQTLTTRSGCRLHLQTALNPLLDPDGKLSKILYLGTNLSDQSELLAALERIRERARAKDILLANMSHEVRTPMVGVMGCAELLLTGDLSFDQREQAQMILDSGNRMMALLNDVLDMSEIDAGMIELAREPVDLRAEIDACVNLIRPVAMHKGLTLDAEMASDLPQLVRGDGLRIRQILLNLIGNAVKFTEHGKVSLTVSCDLAAGTVECTVRDTGISIAAGRIERCVQTFSRAEDSIAGWFGGTGLGLSISNELARLMGGQLTIESAPGAGTTACFAFPLELIAAGPAAAVAAPVFDPSRHRLEHLRVLAAEDHDINQVVLGRQMSLLGASLHVVADGAAAVRAVLEAASRGTPFDLVLMDMQMPGMNGLDAARKLRSLGLGPKVLPIVALTANAFRDDIEACEAAGMQAHLAKPVELARLAETLARWGKAPAPAIGPLTVRPLPSREELGARFASRCSDLLAQLEAVRSGERCDPQAVAGLAAQLHNLAGTAAHFGQPELGEAARRFERALRTAAPGSYRGIIAEAAIAMSRAA